jgi:hypothetical protein
MPHSRLQRGLRVGRNTTSDPAGLEAEGETSAFACPKAPPRFDPAIRGGFDWGRQSPRCVRLSSRRLLAKRASAYTPLDVCALSSYRQSAGVVVEHGYHTGLSSRRADKSPSVSRGLAEGFFFGCLARGGLVLGP